MSRKNPARKNTMPMSTPSISLAKKRVPSAPGSDVVGRGSIPPCVMAAEPTGATWRGKWLYANRSERRDDVGSHHSIGVGDAVEIVRAGGLLNLSPLCGGLDPDLAWRYLERAGAAVAS